MTSIIATTVTAAFGPTAAGAMAAERDAPAFVPIAVLQDVDTSTAGHFRPVRRDVYFRGVIFTPKPGRSASHTSKSRDGSGSIASTERFVSFLEKRRIFWRPRQETYQ